MTAEEWSPSLQATYRRISDRLRADPSMPLQDLRVLNEQLHTLATEPTDVTYEDVDAGGIPAIMAKPVTSSGDLVLVYAHGGGMVLGSPNSHRKAAAHLAKSANMYALVVDYRLAPEHRFPAQIDDLVSVHRWLDQQGIAPERTAATGGSAGANLAITSVLRMRALGLPLPAAIVGFSPWVDLESTGDTFVSNASSDSLMSREASEKMAGLYLGETSPTDPAASPLHADLTGLPPQFITAGGAEVLLSSIERYVDRARGADLDVTFERVPRQQHSHELAVGRSVTSDTTVFKAGCWLRSRFGASM